MSKSRYGNQPTTSDQLSLFLETTDAELGLAFDGDGDRLGVVTKGGNIIYPDRQLMLFAADVLPFIGDDGVPLRGAPAAGGIVGDGRSALERHWIVAVAAAGTAPARRAATRPSRRTMSVGIACTSKRFATRGDSSTLTFTSLTRPVRSLATWARAGLTMRHGPHHGAHRSTTTGSGAASATSANVSSSASASHGSVR